MHAKRAATATIDRKLYAVYQEDYKIPIHSLWHTVEILPQPSYMMSSCKSAIVCHVREVFSKAGITAMLLYVRVMSRQKWCYEGMAIYHIGSLAWM